MSHRHRANPSNKGESAPLSCPDCSGVLSSQPEGPARRPLYQCQIGHRYSASSLVHAKEQQLEYALCAVQVLMAQMEGLYEAVGREILDVTGADRKQLRRRIGELQTHRADIEAMIESTHVVE